MELITKVATMIGFIFIGLCSFAVIGGLFCVGVNTFVDKFKKEEV